MNVALHPVKSEALVEEAEISFCHGQFRGCWKAENCILSDELVNPDVVFLLLVL